MSILIHYGEVALKGKNRPDFIERLAKNIERKFAKIKFRLEICHGYFLLHLASETDSQTALENLREISGIVNFSEVFIIPNKIDEIKKALISLSSSSVQANSFSVKARRTDKAYPFSSPEIEKILGKFIQENSFLKKVNLKNPDVIFYVDILSGKAFIYNKIHQGIGGLPLGISGKVVSLLSGGIDSPVASFLMAKRGCQIDFIHFTANSMQLKDAKEYKVTKIVQRLSRFTLRSSLYLLPYIHFNLEILNKNIPYELILFRRFMAKVAEAISQKIRAEAIVTGDNLGQVASQTLSNIVSVSQAIKKPIFRPLIGFDKNEIINFSKKIGTYELSILPYKDCCSLISSKPKTFSKAFDLEIMENKFFDNYQKIIADTLKDAVIMEFENGTIR